MKKNPFIIQIDPSIGTENLGDLIISEAVQHQITKTFPTSRLLVVSSRDIGSNALHLIKKADYAFFGGTNALSANPVFGYRQFATSTLSAMQLTRNILLGVGWWQYQNSIGPLSRPFYKRMLRTDVVHSVRDEYTRQKLVELGITNVVNTGCPTMWELTPFSATIGDSVVFTLTDYHRNDDRDRTLVRTLLGKFRCVRFWPQGSGDISYLGSLMGTKDFAQVEVIAPSVFALDAALDASSGYVGTRLHAGIRALQRHRPSFIIPIDNRATEISKSDVIHLTDPELGNIRSGAEFTFNFRRRPEIDEFTSQFTVL